MAAWAVGVGSFCRGSSFVLYLEDFSKAFWKTLLTDFVILFCTETLLYAGVSFPVYLAPAAPLAGTLFFDTIIRR